MTVATGNIEQLTQAEAGNILGIAFLCYSRHKTAQDWLNEKIRCWAHADEPVHTMADAARAGREYFETIAERYGFQSISDFENALVEIASDSGRRNITRWTELERHIITEADRTLNDAYCDVYRIHNQLIDLGLHDAAAQVFKGLHALSGYSLGMFAGLESRDGALFDDENTV